MKRIILSFSILTVLIGVLALVMKLREPEQAKSSSITAEETSRIAIDLLPGMRFSFDGKIRSEVIFSADQEGSRERIDLAGEIILRLYQDAPEGLLWGISLIHPQLFVNDQDTNLLPTGAGEVYYLTKNGDITEFFIGNGMDTIYANTLKSIALALQLKRPNAGHEIQSDIQWEHQEPGKNGLFDVRYSSLSKQDQFLISKSYVHLRNTDGIKVTEDSGCEMVFHPETGRLSSMDFAMTLINNSSGIKIIGKHTIDLRASSFELGTEDSHKLTSIRMSLNSEKPDHSPPLSTEQRLENFKKIVKGIQPEQMLKQVSAIPSLQDESIPELLIQLEAMVSLDKEFATHLMEHLEENQDQENFMHQLSLIMGAIASMEAENIEAQLLDFSFRHQDNVDITHQTAFALAELDGASQDVFDHLEELTQSPIQEQRTIGILSLGTLGQQASHAPNSSHFLQNALRNADDQEKSLYLAALSNSKNPDHIDVFASFLQSGVEAQMEQALFGLKHVPGERSFTLISQVILTESREGLIVEGIQALAGHLENKYCADVLMQTFLGKSSVRVKMEALSLLAAVAPLEPEVKDFLKQVTHSMSFDPKVKDYAGELLLTI
ncbi:MAG: hypothetical protein ACOH5I_09030 [Oligoflexus sp.]